MKRILQISILISLSLSLLGSSQAAMGGIALRDYPNHSLLNQSLDLQSPNLLGGIIILPNEPFDELKAVDIIERVDHLPPYLLKKIVREEIKLKLFVGKLTDNPTAKYLTGVIPRGYKSQTTWDAVPGIGGGKTVLVKIGFSEKGKGHGSINLELHELAHSIDKYVYNGIRFNPTFLSIWNRERAKLFPAQDYLLTYPEEYFAEAFAYYYFDRHTNNFLKENAEDTYNFIKNLN